MKIKGETLVEVTVSLAILTIIITSSFTLVVQSLRYVSANKQKTQATVLAEEGIEIAYNHCIECGGPGDYAVNPNRKELDKKTEAFPNDVYNVPGYSGYQRIINIRQPNDATELATLINPSLARVGTVDSYWVISSTVSWNYQGRSDSTTIKTIYARAN